MQHDAAGEMSIDELVAAVRPSSRIVRETTQLWWDLFMGSPIRSLAAYRRLTVEVLPWFERVLVHRARRDGSSWTGIARVLGRSRQAVQQRHDRVVRIDEMLPPIGAASHFERQADELSTAAGDRRRMRVADDEAVPW